MFFLAWLAAASVPTDSIARCSDKLPPSDLKPALARTVRVETSQKSGSGAIISPDGFIVTAAHVVSDESQVTVVFNNERKVQGRVVRRADAVDVALIRVDEVGLACLPVLAEPAPIGSEVVAIGSPGGQVLSQSVSKGIVSAYREVEKVKVVQTDASINEGNSGGPLVGKDGRLVGVVSFKVVGQGIEGIGFAVAASELAPALGFTWADKTVGLTEAVPPSGPPPRTRFAPIVQLPAGVSVPQTVVYRQRYKPHGELGVASATAAAGALLLAGTFLLMDDPDARIIPGTFGIMMLATGGLYTGVTLRPSGAGRIIVEDAK